MNFTDRREKKKEQVKLKERKRSDFQSRGPRGVYAGFFILNWYTFVTIEFISRKYVFELFHFFKYGY